MNNIKWEDGKVCYAYGEQYADPIISSVLGAKDFQLNEIRQGDYISASELGIEQKYNDAVAVFGLFGVTQNSQGFNQIKGMDNLVIHELKGTHIGLVNGKPEKYCKRKIAYSQLMTIGKLKRAMIEREKSAPKTAPDLTPDVEIKDDWSDKHYNHFYQLTEEDIKRGEVKVDAYFVNRMWKINSWEDTGAGFHILKTLPRIANNKNSLKRELVALKKQIDILCKLHGVNDE